MYLPPASSLKERRVGKMAAFIAERQMRRDGFLSLKIEVRGWQIPHVSGDWIPRGPRSSSFWVPRNLSNHMDRQSRTADLVLVKTREMAGRSQTLPWWLGGGEEKTAENKIHWPRCFTCSSRLPDPMQACKDAMEYTPARNTKNSNKVRRNAGPHLSYTVVLQRSERQVFINRT